MKQHLQKLAIAAMLLAMLLVYACNSTPGTGETQQVLDKIDDVIAHKGDYREKFEQKIDTLRRQATSADHAKSAKALKSIFHHYVAHQSDSAMAYLAKLEAHPYLQENKDFKACVQIGRAESYGVMGLYKAASEALEKVDTHNLSQDVRIYYYQVSRTLYGWMADFGEVPAYALNFKQLTQAYRDSILAIQPESIDRDIVRADKMIVEGKAQEAFALCNRLLPTADERQRTFIHILLADACKTLGRNDDYLHFLAVAALSDLQRGITEYSALPKLALELSKQDPMRAYTYLLCTIDDANYCKARLRSFEASTIFPIIEAAHEAKVKERRSITIAFVVLGAIIFSMLMAFIFLMLQQVKRVSRARQDLADALLSVEQRNEMLRTINEQLVTSDKVKETYIARYLQRCRGYMDTLDNYRRQLLKFAKAKQYEELTARLLGNEMINEEERNFYADFDEAFVTLFPNFVDNFNQLLQEEARTYPKRDEILNTELRIFALIRLGVSDSNRIAHFLNYSLPTIYSYRSRLRNKSILPKSEFDQAVLQC